MPRVWPLDALILTDCISVRRLKSREEYQAPNKPHQSAAEGKTGQTGLLSFLRRIQGFMEERRLVARIMEVDFCLRRYYPTLHVLFFASNRSHPANY